LPFSLTCFTTPAQSGTAQHSSPHRSSVSVIQGHKHDLEGRGAV
jgi:hypothetical protein